MIDKRADRAEELRRDIDPEWLAYGAGMPHTPGSAAEAIAAREREQYLQEIRDMEDDRDHLPRESSYREETS